MGLHLPRSYVEVLDVLSDCADQHGGVARGGKLALAKKTGRSVRQVVRVTRALVQLGVLEVVQEGSGSVAGGRGNAHTYALGPTIKGAKIVTLSDPSAAPVKGDKFVTPIKRIPSGINGEDTYPVNPEEQRSLGVTKSIPVASPAWFSSVRERLDAIATRKVRGAQVFDQLPPLGHEVDQPDQQPALLPPEVLRDARQAPAAPSLTIQGQPGQPA
ncbi:MAG: hypothetical protein QOE92_676 [Chloroflexota bacterium]|nr:hypothetical protein [Chloroflexota bacterium]